MKVPKSFTTVTTLSKTIALIMFIALPFIAFCLGYKYNASVTQPLNATNLVTTPTPVNGHLEIVPSQDLFGVTYEVGVENSAIVILEQYSKNKSILTMPVLDVGASNLEVHWAPGGERFLVTVPAIDTYSIMCLALTIGMWCL